MDAARNLASDPALVQAKYAKMLEHQQEWSSDRGVALAIRRALEQLVDVAAALEGVVEVTRVELRGGARDGR